MKAKFLHLGAGIAIGLGVGFGLWNSGRGVESVVTGIGSQMRTRGSDRGNLDFSRGSKHIKKARSMDDICRQADQSYRFNSLSEYYFNLSPGQFSIEADKIEELPFNERNLARVLLFGRWAEVDPKAAMAHTDTMGYGGAYVRPTVLQVWASTDPVNAAKYFTENRKHYAMIGGAGGSGMHGPAEIIAVEWAKQDPAGAMAWASGLKNNSMGVVSNVVSEVTKTDPIKAASMANEITEFYTRCKVYEGIAKQWAKKDFNEAASWVASLPEGERVQAMTAAIEGLASSNPVLASKEWTKMTDPNGRVNAAPIVAISYARIDLQGSMTWLNSLDDEVKGESVRAVMPVWVSADPAAALNFIKIQTKPEVIDRAAAAYVLTNRSSKPAELVDVVAMISHEESRSRATDHLAARWMQEDKAAATDYINSSDSISEDMKARLLSK